MAPLAKRKGDIEPRVFKELKLNGLKDKQERVLHTLRISVTDRCNFRCSYCMPADKKYKFTPQKQAMTFDEILDLVHILIPLGVNRIKLTGGEPLLRNDLHLLVNRLSKIHEIQDLTLTTNGYLLEKYAKILHESGLKRLTVSIDAIDPQLYQQMSGTNAEITAVLNGLKAAQQAGFSKIKLNAVIKKGVNEHQVLPLVRFAREHGFIMRFIEYMDVGISNGWTADQVYSEAQILNDIQQQFPLQTTKRDRPGEVSNNYQYSDGKGDVGVIASVTKPFCASCDRLRVSTDGKIYTCLFSHQGLDILQTIRAKEFEVLKQKLTELWHNRNDRYSEQRATTHVLKFNRVEMFKVGG